MGWGLGQGGQGGSEQRIEVFVKIKKKKKKKYSVLCPFQDYFTHRDEPINRWGETGVLRENHQTHPQAELVLSPMWPVQNLERGDGRVWRIRVDAPKK